jgi:hypothetical protein
MPKAPETTSSTATRQIRPPPLFQHLREFASRPDAWVVLARNMIPVVGIYAFGCRLRSAFSIIGSMD